MIVLVKLMIMMRRKLMVMRWTLMGEAVKKS